MKTLNERTHAYEITRWAVIKIDFAMDHQQWTACPPGDEESAGGGIDDAAFETFAEAIEYAQKQARA